MATAEQKNKKVGTAQRKVDAIQSRIDKAKARVVTANKVVTDLEGPLRDAQANLKYVQAMPVNGTFEPTQDETPAEGVEDAQVEDVPAEPEPAFV